MKYIFDVWSAVSQLLNAICGGVPCETISGRAHRANGWSKKVINKLFFRQEDHCRDAHSSDIDDACWLLRAPSLAVDEDDSSKEDVK